MVKKIERYYSDRTLILLASCCFASALLALFGKLDSGGVLGVFTVAIGGWCSKRGIEEFKKPELTKAITDQQSMEKL